MNPLQILGSKAASRSTIQDADGSTAVPQFRSPVSRRQFARAVAGTAAAGAALASGAQMPESAHSRWTFAPVPIPGGTPGLNGYYHIFGPSPAAGGDPIDAEPATITNFDGFVGLAYLSGKVTQTNTKTGEQELLPFVDSDMRFMKGTFRGTDKAIHEAAFGFV
jgi:hypothetical protein